MPDVDKCPYVIENDGDVELWVFDGDGWAFPVYAVPAVNKPSGDRFYRFQSVFPLMKAQRALMDSRISLNNCSERQWVLRESDMKTMAHKAPGITPERYYRWEGVEASLPKPAAIIVDHDAMEGALSKSAGDFLKHVSAKTGVCEYAKLKLIWAVVCREGIKWLLDGNALDIGFARLQAAPVRANWKEIMYSAFPNMGLIFHKGDRRTMLLESGMESALHSRQMMALEARGKPCFTWTIEVVEQAAWRDTVRKLELERLGMKASAEYAHWWLKTISRLSDKLWDVYETWLEKTRHPYGRIAEGRHPGSVAIVPDVRNGRVRSVGAPLGDSNVINEDALRRPPDLADINKVGRKNEKLLPLSVVLSTAENLWQPEWENERPGHDVGEPGYDADRANGLPLPDAAQVKIGNGHLLGEGHGSGNGMEG